MSRSTEEVKGSSRGVVIGWLLLGLLGPLAAAIPWAASECVMEVCPGPSTTETLVLVSDAIALLSVPVLVGIARATQRAAPLRLVIILATVALCEWILYPLGYQTFAYWWLLVPGGILLIAGCRRLSLEAGRRAPSRAIALVTVLLPGILLFQLIAPGELGASFGVVWVMALIVGTVALLPILPSDPTAIGR